MTPFTSKYETIKETSLKEKSLDHSLISDDVTTPNQGKIQSTFLQTVCSNKFVVALVVGVLALGIMAYNANSTVASSNQFRAGNYAAIVHGSKGGGITGSEFGGPVYGGCWNPWTNCEHGLPESNSPTESPIE